MKNNLLLFAIVTTAALLSSCSTQKESVASSRISFDSTLAIHLDAVQTANLEALTPTVADSVTLIFPSGETLKSKKEFIDLHTSWFAEKNWEWEPKILEKESDDSMGYALVKYLYTTKDSVGGIQSLKNNYLVLVFKNSADGWQLIHDQNTRIP